MENENSISKKPIPWEKWEIEYIKEIKLEELISKQRNSKQKLSIIHEPNKTKQQTIIDYLEQRYISDVGIKMEVIENLVLIDHIYSENVEYNEELEKYYERKIDRKEFRKKQNVYLYESEDELIDLLDRVWGM